MNPYIQISTEEDALYLSKNLRQEDINECKAHSNLEPKTALLNGVKYSHLPLTIFNKDKPVFISGVVPQANNVGMIWLLSSPELEKMSITFLRNCKKVLECFHTTFPVVFNYVDARNTLHINWLKWMGFTFINVYEKFGYEKIKFYEFVRVK